jgi:hypothetical protein
MVKDPAKSVELMPPTTKNRKIFPLVVGYFEPLKN